jgi:hypothetical protein
MHGFGSWGWMMRFGLPFFRFPDDFGLLGRQGKFPSGGRAQLAVEGIRRERVEVHFLCAAAHGLGSPLFRGKDHGLGDITICFVAPTHLDSPENRENEISSQFLGLDGRLREIHLVSSSIVAAANGAKAMSKIPHVHT